MQKKLSYGTTSLAQKSNSAKDFLDKMVLKYQ